MHESRALPIEQLAGCLGTTAAHLNDIELDIARLLAWECDRVSLPLLAGYLILESPEAAEEMWLLWLQKHTEFWCDLAVQGT